MPARQHCDGPDGVKQVLKAHGAVLVHAVGHAHMAVTQGRAVAAVARAAVEEVGPAADSADAAVVAVELLLAGVVVEEVALHAAVAAKADGACAAHLGHRLPRVAEGTHNLRDQLSLQPVPLCWVLQGVWGSSRKAAVSAAHEVELRRHNSNTTAGVAWSDGLDDSRLYATGSIIHLLVVVLGGVVAVPAPKHLSRHMASVKSGLQRAVGCWATLFG